MMSLYLLHDVLIDMTLITILKIEFYELLTFFNDLLWD